VLFIFFKVYIKIGRVDNKVIKNYFYDLKLQDKSTKDLYILIKYGYTINDTLAYIADNTPVVQNAETNNELNIITFGISLNSFLSK